MRKFLKTKEFEDSKIQDYGSLKTKGYSFLKTKNYGSLKTKIFDFIRKTMASSSQKRMTAKDIRNSFKAQPKAVAYHDSLGKLYNFGPY